MRPFRGVSRLVLLTSLAVLYGGCRENGDEIGGPGGPQDAETVEEVFRELDPWAMSLQDTNDVALPDTLSIDEFVTQNGVEFVCTVVDYDLKKNFNDLIAVGANSGVLWPGAMIQGRSLRDGVLASFTLPRSPITLSIDLAIANPQITVDNPTSASVQAAIAALQRRADGRFGSETNDVLPARLSFIKQEAYSASQATLAVGLNVKYNAGITASFDAAYSSDRSLKAKTIVVRLFQPMYTISFADEAHATPADFFDPSVTVDDFNQQQRLGTISPDNQPTYVKSVTYGRMMLFTMTSTEVESVDSLGATLSVAVGAFSGGAELSKTDRARLSNSTYNMVALGGTEAAALAAIRTGNFKTYFEELNPIANAVPLSYRVNVLQDKSLAVLGDNTQYTARECTVLPFYLFTVTLESIRAFAGCDTVSEFITHNLDGKIDSTGAYTTEVFIDAKNGDGTPIDSRIITDGDMLSDATRFVLLPLSDITELSRVRPAILVVHRTAVIRLSQIVGSAFQIRTTLSYKDDTNAQFALSGSEVWATYRYDPGSAWWPGGPGTELRQLVTMFRESVEIPECTAEFIFTIERRPVFNVRAGDNQAVISLDNKSLTPETSRPQDNQVRSWTTRPGAITGG